MQSRSYTGTVEPRRRSLLSFEVGGKVLDLNADDGTPVYEGQMLGELDKRRLENEMAQRTAQWQQAKAVLEELQNGSRKEDIAAANARVEEVRAELKFHEAQLARSEELHRRNVISNAEHEESIRSREGTSMQMESARKEYEKLVAGPRREQIEAQQAMVDQLAEQIKLIQINLDDTKLFAPFSGKIVRRLVDEGVVVSAGQSVYELLETSHLEARVGIPVEKSLLLKLAETYPALIHGKQFELTLKALSPEVDPSTRTRLAIFSIPDTAAGEIVAEEVVRLMIDETVSGDGYWLPISGLQKSGRGLWSCYELVKLEPQEAQAMGITSDESVYQTRLALVEILSINGQNAFVRGTIGEGDLILSEGAHRIAEGQLVTLIK